ncbi:MAG: PIN domain-containing protein [Pseudomonadota bacterium]
MSLPRVFIDACVLFPGLVREIVLTSARDRFSPVWSQRVLDEWRLAVARKQGAEAENSVLRASEAMAKAFPDAVLPPQPVLEQQIALPDPADAHVVAAASGRTDIVLTFNLRDFPRRVLAGHNLTARDPDGFLWEIFSDDPGAMSVVIGAVLAEMRISHDDGRKALKRARLPRLGKAWEAMRT